MPVRLILFDLHVCNGWTAGDTPTGNAGKPPTLDELVDQSDSNGFALVAALDEPDEVVPKDFRFKPTVAMVSSLAEACQARAVLRPRPSLPTRARQSHLSLPARLAHPLPPLQQARATLEPQLARLTTGCDALLPKPLSAKSLRVLIEASEL